MNEKHKGLFLPGPMAFFKCSRKLSTYLMRVKLYFLKRSEIFLGKFLLERGGIKRQGGGGVYNRGGYYFFITYFEFFVYLVNFYGN